MKMRDFHEGKGCQGSGRVEEHLSIDISADFFSWSENPSLEMVLTWYLCSISVIMHT